MVHAWNLSSNLGKQSQKDFNLHHYTHIHKKNPKNKNPKWGEKEKRENMATRLR
jgi:hypothetical protein